MKKYRKKQEGTNEAIKVLTQRRKKVKKKTADKVKKETKKGQYFHPCFNFLPKVR